MKQNIDKSKRISKNMRKYNRNGKSARAKLNASIQERIAKMKHNGEVISKHEDEEQKAKEKKAKEEEQKIKAELRKEKLARRYYRMAINYKMRPLFGKEVDNINYKVDNINYNDLVSLDFLYHCLKSNSRHEKLVCLHAAFNSVLNDLNHCDSGDAEVNILTFHCKKIIGVIEAAMKVELEFDEIAPVHTGEGLKALIKKYDEEGDNKMNMKEKKAQMKRETLERYREYVAQVNARKTRQMDREVRSSRVETLENVVDEMMVELLGNAVKKIKYYNLVNVYALYPYLNLSKSESLYYLRDMFTIIHSEIGNGLIGDGGENVMLNQKNWDCEQLLALINKKLYMMEKRTTRVKFIEGFIPIRKIVNPHRLNTIETGFVGKWEYTADDMTTLGRWEILGVSDVAPSEISTMDDYIKEPTTRNPTIACMANSKGDIYEVKFTLGY